MVILYVLLVAYILAINFYAFLQIKTLKEKEEISKENQSVAEIEAGTPSITPNPSQKITGKLLITGLLGGAITLYVCMFIFKYKRSDLLLMVLMPLLGVLNLYLWVLLFRSGFSFFILR